MDKNCQLIKFDGDHLLIENGPVAIPPVVNSESIMVIGEGELPPGSYYYAVTSIGVNGESAPFSIIHTYAFCRGNSVVIVWKPILYITEYRVYRGKTYGVFDGYFTVFTRTGHFQDNGMGELNIAKTIPPEVTRTPDTFQNRKIHRKAIKKTGSLFLGGEPHTIHLYLVMNSGETITIDLMKVVNQPGWSSSQKHGLLRALTEIGEWVDADKS